MPHCLMWKILRLRDGQEILQYTYDNIKIRTEEADCMYSGIMIDTNNFMTKTGVRTSKCRIPAQKRCGCDPCEKTVP